jgi:hypothetical protein
VQPTSISTLTNDNHTISIKDFLARPHALISNSVGTASAVNATLYTVTATDLLSVAPWQAKLFGVYGFKCTVVFRLETSIQPFQNGILMSSIIPVSGFLPATRVGICSSRLSLRRQLPSVVHNASFTNSTEMRFPFTSPENFHRIGVSPSWFTYSVCVYSPVGPSGTIPYTVWCHLEDVELIGAVAQSGMPNPADRETSNGILSRPLRAFSVAFHEASHIPLLSSFAETTAWFLNASSKAASAFGFSNPNSVEHRKAVVPKSSSHPNSCDVVDNLDSHGLFISNKIGHLDNFSSNPMDEMSINYIASTPMVVRTINWTSANAQGSTLSSWACQPSGMFDSYSVATSGTATSVFVVPPATYIARSAGYWRGSLCYRIHFNKSVFHTGRFAIVFNPGGAAGISSSSIPLHKMIVDIRNNYSVDFIVPFISNQLYLPTTGANVSFGTVSIVVLEALNAPATVNSTLTMTIEFAAGPDFEVASITGNNDLGPIMAQSSVAPMVSTSRICEGAYNLTGGSTDPTLTPALFSMGERITSIRQILKRSSLFYNLRNTSNASRAYEFFTDPYNVILPNAITGSAFVPLLASQPMDFFSKFSPLFGLMRGSMVYRVYATANSPNFLLYSDLIDTGVTSSQTNNIAVSALPTRIPNIIVSTSQAQGALEVHVPYYSSTHSIPTDFALNKINTDSSNPYSSNHELNLAIVTPNVSQEIHMMIERQIGEDFSFGCYLGVLPMASMVNSVNFP